ncbi:MAG: hypothetical protein J6M60_06820 [Clostridia bacterium]|nr:hypothetical protein [Clostridia bacterium]
MEKKKKIIIYIIFILLFIALLIGFVILLNFSNNEEVKTHYELSKVYEQDWNLVEDENEEFDEYYYNAVKNNIQAFYNSLNSELYLYRDDENNLKKYSDREINEILIQYLSKDYIKENNITVDNLNNYVKTFDTNQQVEIFNMKSSNGDITNTYAVHGVTLDLDYQIGSEFKFYVVLDKKNKTFSIEPMNQSINDIDSIEVKNKDEEIESNSVNTTSYSYVLDSKPAQSRLNKYKNIVLVNPEIAYNFLDTEYRDKRFGSLENFKQYVQNNIDYIKSLKAEKYVANMTNDYTEHVVENQYGIMYVFTEKNPIDFTIKLDTYTIDSEKDIEDYKKLTNAGKVQTNVDTFFQMLNSKDYSAAYNVLSDGFKDTYFKTEASFEQFMKQTLYENCEIDYGNFSDKISGVFTQYVEIKNRDNKNDKKIRMNIIMQLDEGTGYKLSFEIL